MSRSLRTAAAGLTLFLTLSAQAHALPPGFSLVQVHGGLDYPTTIRFTPDGRMFVAQLDGSIRYYPTPASTSSLPWLTVPVTNVGEKGLLGMAFHPEFPESAYVYLFHTNPDPLANRLVRYVDIGTGSSPAILIELPAGPDFHHGGRVAFGPDGMIYVTYGDQLNVANPQNPSALPGKILRLGRGGLPAPGNPYGVLNPAALMGVRNPFGLCFDPVEGTGYFTENGPECDDEVNLLSLGANYGWGSNDFCGSQPAGSHPAIATFDPTIAPTGCVVYREARYPQHFQGNLFFGAFNTRKLYRVRFEAGRPDLADTLESFADFPEPVLDVTVGLDGLLWVATTSRIYRIAHNSIVGVEPPAPAIGFDAAPNPFRGSVSFRLRNLPSDAQAEIVDLMGRSVRTWPAPLPPTLRWDGKDAHGQATASGIYLARVTGRDFVVTQRLVRLGD